MNRPSATSHGDPLRVSGATDRDDHHACLLRLGDAIRQLSDPIEIQTLAARILGEHLRVDQCCYAEVKTAAGVKYFSVDCDYHTAQASTVVGTCDLDSYGAGATTRFARGESFVVTDVATSEQLGAAEKAAYIGRDIAACVVIPILRDGDVVAVLSVQQAACRVWTSGEIAFVEAAAERVWAAVERACAERAWRKAHDELERKVHQRTSELSAVMKRLIDIQEDERRQIARDLHDDIGQKMTALHLQLASLKHELTTVAALEQLQRTQELAVQVDRDLRVFASELRSAALYTLGLVPALEDLTESFSATYKLPVSLEVVGNRIRRLAPDLEINLYRIAQEAVQNVHKHADARRVDIFLQLSDERVVLTISDDGRGVRPTTGSASDRMGLMGMRERAALLGGRVQIESSPREGTSILVAVPAVYLDQA
jgi:signal transduction histidine kinase